MTAIARAVTRLRTTNNPPARKGASQYLAVYFVSITRLRLRHWRFLPTFAWYALFSTLQARCAAGHRFSLVAKDAGLVF